MNLTLVNKSLSATQQREPNHPIGQPRTQIRTARISDQKYIIATMILAFSGDSATRWLYPDPYQYLTYFPRFVEAFGGKAFAQETAYCIEGYSGAALWFPPGVEPDVEPVIELIQQSVGESKQGDVFALFEQSELKNAN